MTLPSIRRIYIILLLLSLAALTACRSAAPAPAGDTASPLANQPSSNVTAVASAAPTMAPATPTATQEVGQVLLIAPQASGADPAGIRILLEELAAAEGLQVTVQASLEPASLGPAIRRVVVLPPDPGVAALAAAAPAVQFLAVGLPGVEPAANLSVIAGERPDQQGFLAGMIAAVVTPDWRVGVLSLNDTPVGKAARLGFLNGAVFFCGLCNPANGPIVDYPLAVEFASTANAAERQAAADTLLGQAVRTLYLSPGTEDPELLAYLAQKELSVIGSGQPPVGMEGRWIASASADPAGALRAAWPAWVAGQASQAFGAPVGLTHINPELLSPGRQAWIEAALSDLLAGWIDTGVDPATGEPR